MISLPPTPEEGSYHDVSPTNFREGIQRDLPINVSDKPNPEKDHEKRTNDVDEIALWNRLERSDAQEHIIIGSRTRVNERTDEGPVLEVNIDGVVVGANGLKVLHLMPKALAGKCNLEYYL